MPCDIRPFETGKRTHSDIVKLREQKRINEMPAIDCEFRIIDSLLRDLESRRPRAEKTAASSPVEFGFQFLCATDEIRQIEPEQVVTFDHIRIALLDERGKPLQRVSLGFIDAIWIDNDQFFPAGVVRNCNAHDMIVGTFERQHFELHSYQFFKRQIFEQGTARGGEIMLHWVREREEVAPGILQSVTQRDEFLPTIDGDQPAILEIAAKFLGFNAEIDYVAVGPDEWMKRLDVGDRRSISFPAIDFHRSRLAKLNGDDARRRISAKEQRVFLEFHRHPQIAQIYTDSKRVTLTSILFLVGRGGREAPVRVGKIICGNLRNLWI